MKNIRRKAAMGTITFLGAGLALYLLVSRAPAGSSPLPQNTTDQIVAVDSFKLGLSAMILDRPEAFRIQELADGPEMWNLDAELIVCVHPSLLIIKSYS